MTMMHAKEPIPDRVINSPRLFAVVRMSSLQQSLCANGSTPTLLQPRAGTVHKV